jgi:hypothetical protein
LAIGRPSSALGLLLFPLRQFPPSNHPISIGEGTKGGGQVAVEKGNLAEKNERREK